MGTSNFSDDFKRDVVAQITERSYSVSEVSKRQGVSAQSLYGRRRSSPRPLIRVRAIRLRRSGG